jgi:hypothetical protein
MRPLADEIQPDQRQCDSQQAQWTRGLVEPDDAGYRHDGSSSRENRRHGRQRSTALKQQKERDGSRPNTNAGKYGVRHGDLLFDAACVRLEP